MGLVVDVIVNGYHGAARPGIWVAPDDEVSIGKKPRDDTSGDTYAGDIDNIRISRWEPVTGS